MSGSTTGTGYTEADAGLYDPNLHDNQLVAVYETRTRAEAARDALVGAGIPQSAIQVIDATASGAQTGTTTAEVSEGFWGAIKSLFAPNDDYEAYHHAIGRGDAMVVVTTASGMDRQRVVQVLEQSDPIDFDARMQEWRQSGTSSASTLGVTGAVAGSTLGTTTAGARTTGTAATTAMGATGAVADRTADQDTIKVVQERLRVGKREVAQGAVRVRSYVVERPVEEQVQLHSEHVTIERHAVDRPADPAEAGLFQERTIEARARGEEAVVQKDVRVVEEIGIRKEAADRTETIRDTVRETKVEVEDQTTQPNRTGTGTSSTPGTTTGRSTPRP